MSFQTALPFFSKKKVIYLVASNQCLFESKLTLLGGDPPQQNHSLNQFFFPCKHHHRLGTKTCFFSSKIFPRFRGWPKAEASVFSHQTTLHGGLDDTHPAPSGHMWCHGVSQAWFGRAAVGRKSSKEQVWNKLLHSKKNMSNGLLVRGCLVVVA